MVGEQQKRIALPYQGRFAPSPTGFLHFGSLVAALGSYLDARSHQGKWLVRIEDIEAHRVVPGGSDKILQCLEKFGLEWDGPIVKQSERTDLYHWALSDLQLNAHAYACACSPEDIAAVSHTISIDGGPRYPGTCRAGLDGEVANAWRLRVPDRELAFMDRIQGVSCQNLAQRVGDFVLMRADGEVSYQLAVVVDDIEQGINAIVRGYDLFDSTVRQKWLYHCLGKVGKMGSLGQAAPSYAHLPVVVDAAGRKLSKRSGAKPVDPVDPAGGSSVLAEALRFLGHTVPEELNQIPPREFLQWAVSVWDISRVPAVKAVFPGAHVSQMSDPLEN